MRLLFSCGHPADVHFFKNAIWDFQCRGHQVAIASREKDVTTSLLDWYGFKHEVHTKASKGRIRVFREMLQRDYKMYMLARRFKPDVLVGCVGSVCVPTVARMFGRPSIVFDDTEHSRYEHFIMDRLATVICTPTCYKKDLGRKHIRVNSYKELAYLHPNYFKPDHSVLAEIGLTEGQRFVVVRFVSWGASHDIGQSGFSHPKDVVQRLEPYGRVLITSEGGLDADLEKYRITVPPQKLHDLLYFATLYVGEGATIASECAVLGTPAIYVNSLRVGYLDEQEGKYGLVYNFSDPRYAQEQAVERALELLQRSDLKAEWNLKRERLLQDKVDVTKFMVDFVENYPKSFEDLNRSKGT